MGNKKRPENMTDFESILEKNVEVKYEEKWHPISVSSFEEAITQGDLIGIGKELKKNIAYSLQYLQYIQLQLKEVHLHDIIRRHLWKTYIITAMGIVEGIFYHLVTFHGLEKKTEWDIENKPVHTNVFQDGTEMKKYIITVQKKLSAPRVEQMDFEYLINKVQEKKLLSLSGKAFPYLKRVKRIRNKVHLQIEHGTDITDYKSINYDDYILTRYILYKILTDSKLCTNNSGVLIFIALSPDERKTLSSFITEEETNGQP